MNAPHFCVRVEIALTDADDQREYHVVLGGMQRGGLSVQHGYLGEGGPDVLDTCDGISAKIRELLDAYVLTWTSTQLVLDLP